MPFFPSVTHLRFYKDILVIDLPLYIFQHSLAVVGGCNPLLLGMS